MDYLEGLNKEQKKAVLQTEGPLLILAGAGSGKTRVLTHRIAYLINECNVRPYNILAITFTNKAAKEMKDRVSSLLGDISLNMWISTFHSFCARVLRMEIEVLGYDRDFVIYDTAESQTVIKDCIKQLNFNEKDFNPKYILSVISNAKETMMRPDEFAKMNVNDFVMTKIAQIYELYQETLKKNNALDFDDLIFLTVDIFELYPEILSKYQNKFHYIMVDEYQDTNASQYKLISLLSRKHGNLCVVGDDDQSIYSFRGADITNILNFEDEYKDATVIKLEQNYRSTSNILSAANNVITNNNKRKNKKLWTDKGQGSKIQRYQAFSEHDEAQFVVTQIKDNVNNKGKKYSDIAILYRINAMSRVMEEGLMRSSIPYKIIGGQKFYERKEIKDIIAYLRLINNFSDDYALKRIINVPKRGIGDVTFNNAREIAEETGKDIFQVITNPYNYPELSRSADKLQSFATMISLLAAKKDSMKLSDFIEEVMDKSGIIKELNKENSPEAKTRIENLKEFVSVAVEYEDSLDSEAAKDAEAEPGDDVDAMVLEMEQANDSVLRGFLESISLVADIDNVDDDGNYVLLMTMHSSKGLEFPVVFLIGFEEGIFPSMRSYESESEIEEERRLCYVGITRAQEELYITNASSRMLFGSTRTYMPSRFIEEIPSDLLDDLNNPFPKSTHNAPSSTNTVSFGRQISTPNDVNKDFLASLRRKKVTDALNANSPTASAGMKNTPKTSNPYNYQVNQRVNHKKFGQGIITKVEGKGKETTVEINFDGVGMRRLMAEYAKLEVI